MAEKHYHEQVAFAKDYLVDYFQRRLPGFSEMRILEVGSAESGLLAVLHARGLSVTGIELSPDRVALAQSLNPHLNVRVGDITDASLPATLDGPYDLIILRDVIEHVPNRHAAFANLAALLAPNGFVYMTFPPRFSPFAGHQQNGRSLFRRLPWLQLWPPFIVRLLGRRLQEWPHIVDQVIENGRMGLSIRRFRQLAAAAGFHRYHEDLFFSRPIYQQRFGWRPRRFPDWPLFREWLVTGCEALLQKK